MNITARPVTAGGLGTRTTATGSGRKVQDTHYFAGLLRGKMTEITQEISRMRGDTERLAKDSSLTVQLERRYEGAVKEVRALEGELADFNLAMDKARTNVEASEIQAFLATVKRRNEAATREVPPRRGLTKQRRPRVCCPSRFQSFRVSSILFWARAAASAAARELRRPCSRRGV